jgi:hypothetical protein
MIFSPFSCYVLSLWSIHYSQHFDLRNTEPIYVKHANSCALLPLLPCIAMIIFCELTRISNALFLCATYSRLKLLLWDGFRKSIKVYFSFFDDHSKKIKNKMFLRSPSTRDMTPSRDDLVIAECLYRNSDKSFLGLRGFRSWLGYRLPWVTFFPSISIGPVWLWAAWTGFESWKKNIYKY